MILSTRFPGIVGKLMIIPYYDEGEILILMEPLEAAIQPVVRIADAIVL
jgi:hypothetical protein